MEARCKKCNDWESFSLGRGTKISNYSCHCGGAYERMSRYYHEGISPNENISQTIPRFPNFPNSKDTFEAYRNSKGEGFLLDYDKREFIPLPKNDVSKR